MVMLIDEIIGQLMTEYPEAKGFLGELKTGSQIQRGEYNGRVFVYWDMIIQVTWNEGELASEPKPKLHVLDEIRVAVVQHHNKILELARALGVPEKALSSGVEDELVITLARDAISLLEDVDYTEIELVVKQILDQVREEETKHE